MMKRRETHHQIRSRARDVRCQRPIPIFLLILSLGVGLIASGGCVAVPAAMMASAAVNTAGVVAQSEYHILNPDLEHSAIAQSEAQGGARQSEVCQRQTQTLQADQGRTPDRQEMKKPSTPAPDKPPA